MKFASLFVVLVLLSSCTQNILGLHHKCYYQEFSNRREADPYILDNTVLYDQPYSVDEEGWQDLSIVFSDTAAAIKQKHLNLVTDSGLVKCYYHAHSIWHWGETIQVHRGAIQVVSWEGNKVRLKMNLHAYDARWKSKVYYNGARTFTGKLSPPEACRTGYIVNRLRQEKEVPFSCLLRLGMLQPEYGYHEDAEANCEGTYPFIDKILSSVISVPDTHGLCTYYYLFTYNENTGKGIDSKFLYGSCDIDYSARHYRLYENQAMLYGIRVIETTITQKAELIPDNDEANIESTESDTTRFIISDEGMIKVWND